MFTRPAGGVASPKNTSAPQSFGYVLQADAFAKTRAAAVGRLAACDRDWLVLDPEFTQGARWSAADLDTLRAGRPGRRVLAYLSIGEAEDYRPYWQRAWGANRDRQAGAGAPGWLLNQNPQWKGNYRVKYWDADWQQLMLREVETAMAQGFDGVYLDIVDGFETFEEDRGRWIDNRVNPETKQSYRRDMADWVKRIAAAARAKKAGALVIPQNGSQLLAHADFLEAISGMGIEDLFTEGNKLQSREHVEEVLGHLKRLQAATQPVLVIEYPTRSDRRDLARRRCVEHGFTWLITDRQLKTLGESGK